MEMFVLQNTGVAIAELNFTSLLSNDGSEGLDLSFVTHIFFLEEIWDQALMDQAVARAWRMGAKSAVEVETLFAENTVEETMEELERGTKMESTIDDDLNASKSKPNATDYERMKTRHLLQSLKLMTNYHRFGRQVPVKVGQPLKSEETIKRKLLEVKTKERTGKRVRFSDLP
jgi:hypothetical protein